MSTRNYRLALLLLFYSISTIADPFNTAVGNGAQALQSGSESHNDKGEEDKKDGKLLEALMLAAQAAAAAAAAAGNKKSQDKAKAADPINVPQIPNTSMPPVPAEKTEEAKLPELAASTPVPEIVPDAPATTSGVVEMPAAAPSQLTTEVPSDQIVADSPQSDIPETIVNERAKLGYDERNSSASQANAAALNNPSSGNMANAALASGASSSSSASRGATSDSDSKRDRFAKNVTGPEDSGGGGGGDAGTSAGYGSGSGGSEGGKSDGGNMMDMISQMMGGANGATVENTVAHGSPGDGIYSNASAKKGTAAQDRENIFEHASYRYRKMAFEEKIIRKDARRKPALAGVLNSAHDLFSDIVK